MRAISVALAIVALAVIAGFLADFPGEVLIRWQGWRIDTSVAFLVGTTILLALGLWAFLAALAALFRGPRRWLTAHRERRRRDGYEALFQGLVAVASGDPREGARLARKAELLLPKAPQSLFLSAQVAALEGDEHAAKRYFTLMLGRRETELLGLRELTRRALGTGDREAARKLTQKARALRSGAPWVARSLFEVETREGRWEAAERALVETEARQAFAPARARHYRGVLLYELSVAAATAGDRRRALAFAASAQRFCPDLAALAAHHARLLHEAGREQAAARVIERAWRTAPHPDLSSLYGAIFATESPLVRIKRFERLAAQNPEARESHIAVAEAALMAELWGEARRALEKALAAPLPPRPDRSPAAAGAATAVAAAASGPTPRLCLLMARLEEAEYGAEGRAREWRDRALLVPPDPLYVCTDCGGESPDWHTLCPSCAAFDALFWHTPLRAVPLAVPLPAVPATRRSELSALASAPRPPPSDARPLPAPPPAAG